MKAFITGATGYIGENIAFKLLEQGHEVVALARSCERGKELSERGIGLVIGDLSNKGVLDLAMKDCDAVFHLAAYARLWPEERVIFEEVNVEGTRNILESAKINKVEKVIITSTAGVFGPSVSGGIPVYEDAKASEDYFTHYESTKAEAEVIAKAYAQAGMHVVIVNPARVYGPGRRSDSNAVTKMVELFSEGKWRIMPGNGKKIGSYAYVDDVVEGHLKAWKHGRSGENYLLGGENVSYQQLFQVIKRYTKSDQQLFKVPVLALIAASKLDGLRAKITRNSPLITPAWVKKYLHDWSVSSSKAAVELGYTITPLDEGIRKTVEWLKGSEKKDYTLVTGASTGIGKAMAKECASRNHNLILVALPGSGLRKVRDEILEKYKVDVQLYEIDLIESKAAKRLYRRCEEQGFRINVLINNAGVGNCSSFVSTDLDHYTKMIRLNAEVVVALSSTFIPKLKESKQAYILNMGSFASIMPLPFKSVYCATKSFVLSFSRALQMELKEEGIHVACVCPGPTRTEAVVKRHELLGKKSEILMLSPEEVARIAINGMFRKKSLIIPGWKNKLILSFQGLISLNIKSFVLNRIFKKGAEEVASQIEVNEEFVTPEIPSSLYEYSKNLN